MMDTECEVRPLPEGKVKLISGDDFEFIVDESAARVSTTIRGMLDSEGPYTWCTISIVVA